MPTQRLLVATGNPNKIRELAQILAQDSWEFLTPKEAGIAELDVVENGATYRKNAAKKARAYANASGLPALADDSGLEVDALDGAPGVLSARYAGIEATGGDQDRANRAKLLDALATVPRDQRTARFRAVVAVSLPYGPDVWFGEGTVEGRIAEDERGDQGFGYDPVFELPDGRRMAELAADEKNQISHRAQAAEALRPMLAAIRATLERSASSAKETHANGSDPPS